MNNFFKRFVCVALVSLATATPATFCGNNKKDEQKTSVFNARNAAIVFGVASLAVGAYYFSKTERAQKLVESETVQNILKSEAVAKVTGCFTKTLNFVKTQSNKVWTYVSGLFAKAPSVIQEAVSKA